MTALDPSTGQEIPLSYYELIPSGDQVVGIRGYPQYPGWQYRIGIRCSSTPQ